MRASAPTSLAACLVALVAASSAWSEAAAPTAGPGYVVTFQFAYDSPPFPDTRHRITATLTGEVCGDPVENPWTFVGERTGGPSTPPTTVTTVTFAAANPATITSDRWSDENDAEIGRIEFVLRLTPRTPPRLSASWEVTGDIQNVVATPTQTPATAKKIAACPAAPAPTPARPGTPTGSPAAGYAAGRVKLPGQRAFARIARGQALPFGTAVDVSNGRGITLTDGGRGTLTISGQRDGVLSIVTIARVAGIVELRLTGGKFTACGTRDVSARAVRRVWANGTGKFRTKGRYASAGRNGWWLTTDFCDRTVILARRGSLAVTDLVTKRNVAVRAPQTYVARPES